MSNPSVTEPPAFLAGGGEMGALTRATDWSNTPLGPAENWPPTLRMMVSFLDLMAAQIATAVANACIYEEERKRAEALAEIDRAKTTFFSNVSHEFGRWNRCGLSRRRSCRGGARISPWAIAAAFACSGSSIHCSIFCASSRARQRRPTNRRI